LRITEVDYEYLLHTLSEARSRATEIAVSISARVGTEHPLAKLANAAALKVESVLRDVQKNATDQPTASPKVFDLAGDAPAASPAPAAAEANVKAPLPWASFHVEAGVGPEHWVSQFVDELMREVRTSGAIRFETAERLLERHKQTFEHDLAIARRMYRNYPHLFHEESNEAGASQNGRRMLTARV